MVKSKTKNHHQTFQDLVNQIITVLVFEVDITGKNTQLTELGGKEINV